MKSQRFGIWRCLFRRLSNPVGFDHSEIYPQNSLPTAEACRLTPVNCLQRVDFLWDIFCLLRSVKRIKFVDRLNCPEMLKRQNEQHIVSSLL